MKTGQLEKQCCTFSRFLIGQDPTPYVTGKYREYHRTQGAALEREAGRFDRLLVAVAAWHPWLTRLADAYAACFRRRSMLRKKLILLLAILECSPPSFENLDSAGGGGRAAACIDMAARFGVYAIMLTASALVFLPVQAFLSLLGKDRART